MAEAFGHGTGHGLGIEVHEDPRITPAAAGRRHARRSGGPGMVFTIEPGAYFPGWGGVRIEDDVLVTENGVEVLTDVTTELSGNLRLMDLDQLKQILDLVREHELSEFEIEHEGLRLKVRKDAAGGLPVPARASATHAPPRRRRRHGGGRPPAACTALTDAPGAPKPKSSWPS